MATIQEQEQLIQTLKFTPRTYRIELSNYGGEVYIGSVERKVYDYFKENNIDISEYASSWDDDRLQVPEEYQPFPPGSPYECDNLIHASGADMDGGNIVEVYDENDQVIWTCALDIESLESAGVNVSEDEQFCSDDLVEGEVVFYGASGEKGLLFGGEFELKSPFDPSKLSISYSDADGWCLSNSLMYDDEDIWNNDISTNGKWGESKWIIGGDEEVFDPEDQWEVPEHGPSPDEWERSPEFKFKKVKPVHVGWYVARWGHGSTYGSLYWNGKNFVEFNFGKEDIISDDSIDYWQGYNWDTTSWVNQPPEPPNISCSNKKCGWAGMSDDRKTDDKGDDHCPKCSGTDFDWIDYDPMTKKGLTNREKYCKEWDPIEALKRIPVPTDENGLPEAKWPF